MSTERVARVALVALVVGLAVHNAIMAQLWELGVRGEALDTVAAWKEALLLFAFVIATLAAVRRLPGITVVDGLAAIYTGAVLLYALMPQSWLDGDATAKGELLAVRHHLLPVAGYALGRLTAVWWADRSRVGATLALAAAGVAVIGLVDLALISLQAWRESGVPGWYREQLALDYEGLSGLPENWIYNTGEEENPIRRLVSTFLSPLASAYAFVVGIVFVVGRQPFRWWWAVVGLILYAGLLYTHTRSVFVALVVGLVVLAIVQRRFAPLVVAVATVAVGGAFLAAYPSVGPSTHYTEEELEFLRENAAEDPDAPSSDPFSPSESSTESHWRNLRDGVEAVVRHPQGYGLGNAGTVAKRTGVEIKAGESTYTELGIDTGLLGALAFVLWNVALLFALLKREAWVGAAFAAVLLLGLQTDVIGVHWLAVGMWAAAGIGASPRPADTVLS